MKETVAAKILREQDGSGYTAFLDFPNGVNIEVHSPTWRKLVNSMKQLNLDTRYLFEEQIDDGLGFLERVLR